MSDVRWTPEQARAISVRGRHVLVSAAAGSGKTAVLVERIVQRITKEGGDVDRLLVVTFTDAAAAQMRDRLVQRIHEGLARNPRDAHLLRQLVLLPGASISTLHAFCLKVVRQHFYRLGLDPTFRVLDEHEGELLRLESLEAALEHMYENMQPDDAFARLVAAYGGSDGDDALQRFLLQMHDHSRSLPDPDAWLKQCAALYERVDGDAFDASPWAAELQQRALVDIARAERLLRQALALAESPGGSPNHAMTYTEDLSRLVQLRQAAETSWSALVAQRALCTFGRLRPARGDDSDPDVRDRAKDLRDRARKIVAERVAPLLTRSPGDEAPGWRELAEPLRALVECVGKLDEKYAEAKAERGFIDFADIEHLCLELLNMSEVAEEVRARFDEVLVDECQDLNGVQDAILERIVRPAESEGEMFFVGDVKQSIYRFRQADPGLFLARYEGASDEEDAPRQRIDLQANFRSRPGVLHGINFLFRQLMTEAAGEMDYGPDAELVPGLSWDEGAADEPIEVHILEKNRRQLAAAAEARPGAEAGEDPEGASAEDDGDGDLSAFQREARYVADHIRRLVVEEGAPVWDRRLGRYRPARFGDVAVLLRATRHRANELLDELQARGVPAYAELGTGYFAATEVDTMLALLKVLDNPRQDIPLAATLRTIVGLTPEQLARLRIHHRRGDLYDAVLAAAAASEEESAVSPELADNMRTFLQQLDEWRTLARRAPLSKVVWRLLTDTKYFDVVGAQPGGRQRQANLRALYERARQFNHFSRHGLSRFLRFVERLQDAEGDLGAAPALGEGDDVVRIMSVHQSKGLEFPIVYVLDAGRSFSRGGRGGHRDLTFHRELGLGAGFVDPVRRIAQPSLPLEAVHWRRRRDELAEEMRIFYVALTRAKERLIIVGSVDNVDRAAMDWAEAAGRRGWALDDERLLAADSWLDWIGPALMRHEQGEPLRERAASMMGAPVAIADADVARDGSSWRLTVDPPPPHETEGEDALEPPLPWAALAALQPLPRKDKGEEGRGAEDNGTDAAGAGDPGKNGVDARRTAGTASSQSVLEELRQRIRWTYPYSAAVGRAAKQSVSELKRRWDVLSMDESRPVTAFRRRLDDRPAFLHAAGRPLTAAEKGSAVHLVLQHVDLRASLDEAGLAKQIRRLQAQDMLTEQQAAAVNPARLAQFFASPLGRRLQAAPDNVQREVPFTMALPAAEAYPDLDPDTVRGESVIVQGIIDCLLFDGDGLVLIDFKTDRVSEEGAARAAAGYKAQVDLYARALRHMYDQPVGEAYLVFLTPGAIVPMDV